MVFKWSFVPLLNHIDVCTTTVFGIPLRHYTDICTKTVLIGLCMVHYAFSVSWTLVEMLPLEKLKKRRTHQNTILVRSYKSLFTSTLLSSRREERNRVRTESTFSAKQWNKTSWEERERESRQRPCIILPFFCCISNTCSLDGSVFTASLWVWDPFARTHPKWAS